MVKRVVYGARVNKGGKRKELLLTPTEVERAYRRSQKDYKVRKKQGWKGKGEYIIK